MPATKYRPELYEKRAEAAIRRLEPLDPARARDYSIVFSNNLRSMRRTEDPEKRKEIGKFLDHWIAEASKPVKAAPTLRISPRREEWKRESASAKARMETRSARHAAKKYEQERKSRYSDSDKAKIKSIIAKIDKADSISELEQLEGNLRMIVDPEEHNFYDIQEMLYSNSGMNVLSDIVGSRVKMSKKHIVPDDDVGDYHGHAVRGNIIDIR